MFLSTVRAMSKCRKMFAVMFVFLILFPLFSVGNDMSKCRFDLEEIFSFNKELNQVIPRLPPGDG